MKKFFAIWMVAGFVCCVVIGGRAEGQYKEYRSHVGMTVGGGLHTLRFEPVKPESGESMSLEFGNGVDLALGVEMKYFWSDHVGFGAGVGLTKARASVTYEGTETYEGLTHPDNTAVSYDLSTHYEGWKESQNVTLLSIPVEMMFRTKRGGSGKCIMGAAGVEIELPCKASYESRSGSFTTTGYFAGTGHTVTSQPQHGFSTYERKRRGDEKNLGVGLSLKAEAGMRWDVHKQSGVYVGVYAVYGLTSILREGDRRPLVELNPQDASEIIYNGTLGSHRMDGVKVLCVGVKVGVDVGG